MKKDEAMLYCEYCDKLIVAHRNDIARLLGRRDNGIGVECEDCLTARYIKENELYKKKEFPKLVKSQYALLDQASYVLGEFLYEGGSHFFPIEYDGHDLDTDIKNAKMKIDWLKKQTRKVFSRIFDDSDTKTG